MRERDCCNCRFYNEPVDGEHCGKCYRTDTHPEFKPYKACSYLVNKALDCVHTDSPPFNEPCAVCAYANTFRNYKSAKDVKVVIVDSDPKAVDIVRKLLNNDEYAKCAAIILEADTASGVITPPELPADIDLKTEFQLPQHLVSYALKQTAAELRSAVRLLLDVPNTADDVKAIRRIADKYMARHRRLKNSPNEAKEKAK